MNHPDIIIPSCRTRTELVPLLAELEGYSAGCRIVLSYSDGSAAFNRNKGIEQARSGCVIMMDDDIRGFWPMWWEEMIRPLEDPEICMVSARLLRADGSIGEMNGSAYKLDERYETVTAFPSACIAFRLESTNRLRFHEGFKGSGFEDTLFCDQMRERYGKKLVINNNCRLIHLNEMKNQKENFEHNSRLYQELRKK